MNDDVQLHIRSCEHCIHFKQKPEQDEMHSIRSSYQMEIVHIDFLVIGSKKDINKEINVLVITDHFTRYVQAFVTTSQTVHTVAVTLYEKYLVHYGWPEKLHSDQAGNFESNLIAELCKIAQVQKIRMTLSPRRKCTVREVQSDPVRHDRFLESEQKMPLAGLGIYPNTCL